MIDLEQNIKTSLAIILGVKTDEISSSATFSELGLDSLLSLRLVSKLESLLGFEIELEWLYEYHTIEDLSNFLTLHIDGNLQ